jgi:hypothetical protein
MHTDIQITWHGSASIETGYFFTRFQSVASAGIFLFSAMFRPVLKPNKSPIQSMEVAHFFKNECTYMSTPPYTFLEWCLIMQTEYE